MDNPVEKARRIEHRLRTQYAYSLNVDFSRRTDHIRYFLEDGMAGHCEYFATAMALMLRINGIPSRVVNGYATDEWVAASNPYYLVRQEHAHSWVEAWFPNAGWVTFDPTPASGLGNGRVPNTLYRRLTRWYDMIKFQWYDKIIDYDARDQAGMVLAIFRGLDKAANFGGAMGSLLTGHNTTNRGFVGTLLAMVILVGGVVGVGFLMRRRRKRLPTIERGGETLYPKASPIEDYRELLERLQETTPRAPSLTPLEYAHQVATQSEPFAEFVDLTHRYYGARYNGHLWTEQEASRARALLRLLDAERNVGAPSGN
jgi:hypothetical protein